MEKDADVIKWAIEMLESSGYKVIKLNAGESIQFPCRQCGTLTTTKKFVDKAAVACEGCGVIWEVRQNGTVELELLQLVGGQFTEDGAIDKNPRQSVILEIIRKAAAEAREKSWHPEGGCCS